MVQLRYPVLVALTLTIAAQVARPQALDSTHAPWWLEVVPTDSVTCELVPGRLSELNRDGKMVHFLVATASPGATERKVQAGFDASGRMAMLILRAAWQDSAGHSNLVSYQSVFISGGAVAAQVLAFLRGDTYGEWRDATRAEIDQSLRLGEWIWKHRCDRETSKKP